jgi:hypothetical protein
MGEEHLDFLAQMSRLFEGRRAGEGSSRRIRKAFPYYEKSANSHARDAGALRELSNPSRADKREFFEQLHLSQMVECEAPRAATLVRLSFFLTSLLSAV